MDILKVIFSSVVSILVLFALAKLIGNRQLSQLSMFEYINGITIGSITAEMATSLEGDIFMPLTAMLVYGFVTAFFSFLAAKSIPLRRLLSGKSAVLFRNGKIYYDNLKKCKLDLNEFLTQCRIGGYFDLSELDTAIMEQNGKISFLPLSTKRPATPDDFGLKLPASALLVNAIVDGKILYENLSLFGFDELWLKKQLDRQAVEDIKEAFLATVDQNGKLTVYPKFKNGYDGDLFM